LFVAVEIPESVRAAVAEAVAPWRDSFPQARWVPAENLHVTVKFLGGTYPRLLGWIEGRLGEVAAGAAPFALGLSGAGAFPSPSAARVLWAGVDDPDGHLRALAEALDDGLAAEFTRERDAGPFRGHLTVARSEPPLSLPPAFARTSLSAEPFTVDRLVLVRSHVQRPAPRYEPLRTFDLGA
jgi:2'-5' RNA ligase